MSRSETETLIRRYVEALNRSDWDSVLACLGEDVTHDRSEGGRDIGREAFRDFLALSARHYRETLADVVVFATDDGGRAAAEFTVRGEYLATADGRPEAAGQRYSIPGGQFFDIDEGLISRVTSYRDMQAWTAAISER